MKIFHNARCSKSRETLQLLESLGAKPEIVAYLEDVPSVEELKTILRKLQLRPRDILREKEPVFAELKLDLDQDEAVLKALTQHPILIERPIVFTDTAAVIGRPPENVHRLFSE